MVAVLDRHRSVAASLGALLLLAVAAFADVVAAPPAGAAGPGCTAGTVAVVAHPDDDLLFLSPDLQDDVSAGRCVEIVYVTSGDAGRGTAYARGREQGVQAAWRASSGSSGTWTTSATTLSTSTGTRSLDVRTLSDRPSLRLVLLHLPDGGLDGAGTPASGGASLPHLVSGATAPVPTLDGPANTYSRAELVSVIGALVAGSAPATVRTQDFTGADGDGDHPDHLAVARLVLEARDAAWRTAPVVGYLGYTTSARPANVTGAAAGAKSSALFTYAPYDTDMCQSTAACSGRPEAGWLARQHVAATSAPPLSAPSAVRWAGEDRYATAAAVSARTASPGVGVVYVATGASPYDALAGGPAAAHQGGPVLLVARDAVPAATAAELARLHPARVVVLGGPSAVSDPVLSQLRASVASVTRVAGTDRYDTAAQVALQAFGTTGSAYVATGTGYADALAAAAAAGRDGVPLLLVEPRAVPAATASALRALGASRTTVVGGTTAVSDTVAAAVRASSRLAGADRYATAVAISAARSGTGSGSVFVATGSDFPDALAAAPAAAAAGAPVLLSPQGCLPSAVLAEVTRLGASRVVVLGGTNALGVAVQQLRSC